MLINRVWAMPTKDTFSCPPIGEFVKKYLRASEISIDPFARNKRWATYTNDLNPDTLAEWHMDSAAFLVMMMDQGIKPDLAILDPPYSPRQMKECYEGFGLKMNQRSALRTAGWKAEKDILAQIMPVGSVALCFGWHSNGMGKGRGFEILEILLVAHGAAHNDTICMAERKIAHQLSLTLTE